MTFWKCGFLVLLFCTANLAFGEQPIEIKAQLSKDQQAFAEKVVAAVEPNGELGWQFANSRPQAKTYLFLAAQGKSDAVVSAALTSMGNTWTRYPEQERERAPVDEDFIKVVQTRLKSTVPLVQAGAFSASKVLLAGIEPEPTTLTLMLELAKDSSPAVRYAVLQAMGEVSIKFTRNSDTVRQYFLSLLADKEPALVAATLKMIWGARADMFTTLKDQAPVNRALAELRKRPEPALVSLTILISNLRRERMESSSAFVDELGAFLKDTRPAVRAAAAFAAGARGDVAFMANVAALLDDKASVVLSVPTFKCLNGEEFSLEMAMVQSPSTVQHAAVQGLMMLAMPDEGFYCESPGLDATDKDLEPCLEKAKAWWKAHAQKYPAK